MASFAQSLTYLIDTFGGSSNTTTTCQATITHYTFYQVAMLPAAIIYTILAFFAKRRFLWHGCLDGRPGLIHPMDVLTRTMRISYCCAYGTIATLCLKIITEQLYAFEYNGPPYFTVFILMVSMLIYGIGLSPLFVCLAVKSILSFGLGTLYVWTYTGVKFFMWFECPYSGEVIGYLFLRNLPEMIFMTYLCISYPFRFVTMILAYRSSKRRTEAVDDDPKSEKELVEDIRESYHGLQLRRILRKPVEPKEPQTKKEKIIHLIKKIYNKVIYKKEPGFRYSARILVIATVGLTIIYALSCEFLIWLITIFDIWLGGLVLTIETTVGWTYIAGESNSDTVARSSLLLAWYIVYCMKVCMIVSAVFATLIAIVMCLHGLCAYRTNLKAVHRGDTSNIPPSSIKSFQSLMAGGMRFAGYQVAYMTWAWVLQFLVLFLTTIIAAFFIVAMLNGIFVEWVKNLILSSVPALLIGLVVNYAQVLLARFFFLQKYEGELVLGMDNRHAFFVLSYFIYFYNIFLGMVSCLLRIGKSLGLGLLLLSRLDLSTLPKKFETMDPGFQAYIGFIHVESVHTHPAVIVFCDIMSIPIKLRAAKKLASEKGSAVELGEKNKADFLEKRRTRERAINNWQLLYTLFSNPELRIMRRGQLQKKMKNPKLYREEYLKTLGDGGDEKKDKIEKNGIVVTPNNPPPLETKMEKEGRQEMSPKKSVKIVDPKTPSPKKKNSSPKV